MYRIIFMTRVYGTRQIRKEALGMKKWVSFCLALVLLFSAVYVGAQAGMSDSPESMSILLTEGCILLKNSAKLSDLMFLDLDENYVWSGITISPYEWFDLKAAAKSLKIKAEFNGRTLTFDDYLPTGAVIAIETPEGEEKKYTAVLYGDVNCDGKITAADARFLLRVAAKLDTIDDVYIYEAAKLTNGLVVDAEDARRVLRTAALLDDNLRVMYNKTAYYNWKLPDIEVIFHPGKDGGADELEKFEFVESVSAADSILIEGTEYPCYKLAIKEPYIDNFMRLRFECRGDINIYDTRNVWAFGMPA